jgi:predicted regulator of Ras-like GTPase activity (Roadblock/LC7/MglB family)
MFSEKLENMVTSVEGGQAAILMGLDGIPVDMYSQMDIDDDMETIGMEFSVLLGQAQQAAENIDAGAATEMTIRTEKLSTVLRVINDDYFIALAIGANGNLGKARYMLRILAPDLAKEL